MTHTLDDYDQGCRCVPCVRLHRERLTTVQSARTVAVVEAALVLPSPVPVEPDEPETGDPAFPDDPPSTPPQTGIFTSEGETSEEGEL